MDCDRDEATGERYKHNTHIRSHRNNLFSHRSSNAYAHDRCSCATTSQLHRHNTFQSQSQFVPSPLQLQVQELETLYRERIESRQMARADSDGDRFLFHHHKDHSLSKSNVPGDHYVSNNLQDDSDDSSPPPVFHISSAAEDDDEDAQCGDIAFANVDSSSRDQKVPEFRVYSDGLTNNSDYFNPCTSSDIVPLSPDQQHTSHPSSLYQVDHSYEHVYNNFTTIDSSNSSVMTSITSPSTIAALPCFTCCLLKKCAFFCLSCLQLGKFTSSQSSGPLKLTFSERKYEYLHLQDEKVSLNASIGCMLKDEMAKDILQEKVDQVTKRNTMLRERLNELTKELKTKSDQLVDLKPLKDAANSWLRKKRHKMSFAREWTEKLRGKSLKKSQQLKGIQDTIKQVTCNLAVDLRKSIFHIDLYDDTDDALNQSGDLDSRMPLLNCRNSIHVTSTLKHTDLSSYPRYTIVEPWIYGTSGDLIMYDTWMSEHRDDFSSTNSVMDVTSGNDGGNDALRVAASLTYLNHMIHMMAKSLDLTLPRKLQLNEFYHGNESSYTTSNYNEMKFRIAKLNINIIYLCLSQKLDSNLIGKQMRSPLSSLIALLNPSSTLR